MSAHVLSSRSHHARPARPKLLDRFRRRPPEAFPGDPAADGRDAAEAAREASRVAAEAAWERALLTAPVAVKHRPADGPWDTQPFAAVPADPPMADMVEAIDARARENTARFYKSIGRPQVHHEAPAFTGASTAGMPGEAYREFRYEPQPPEILRRVLDGLRAIGPDEDAGPATDLTGQGIFAAMLSERMRHPGSPAGTRCGCCGYRAEGFSAERRSADLSAHVIRELYGAYPAPEPDGWLDSAFGAALHAIRVSARVALDAVWNPAPGDGREEAAA